MSTPVQSPAGLAGSVVLDTEGASVPLASLVGGRPLLLVFLRHYGCLFAKQQADELVRHHAELVAAGAEVVAIGNGTAEEAKTFAEEQALPFRLLTDPTGDSYCALSLKRGLRTALSPAVVARAVRATASGFRQTRSAGDPLQQGGVIAFDAEGREIYRYVSETAGDHPQFGEVLVSLRRASPVTR